MDNSILTDLQSDVNISFTVPPVILIRGIISPKETVIERVYSGGVVDIEPSTVEAIQALEAQLAADGWRVTPSLWHGGFTARMGNSWGERVIPFDGIAMESDEWADNYGLLPPM